MHTDDWSVLQHQIKGRGVRERRRGRQRVRRERGRAKEIERDWGGRGRGRVRGGEREKRRERGGGANTRARGVLSTSRGLIWTKLCWTANPQANKEPHAPTTPPIFGMPHDSQPRAHCSPVYPHCHHQPLRVAAPDKMPYNSTLRRCTATDL